MIYLKLSFHLDDQLRVRVYYAGIETGIIAIKHATKMLDDGDVDGYAVWKRIRQAIEQLESTKPGPDDMVQ